MKTNRYSIYRREDWHWIVRASDPPEFVFPANSPFAGWSLFNPLTPPPEGFIPDSESGRPDISPIGDGRCLVSHRRMDFRSPVEDGDTARLEIGKLLRWLRFATGQADLRTDLVGYQQYLGVAADAPIEAPFTAPPAFVPLFHALATALSFDRIQAVLAACPMMSVPVYADVLLDAIEADDDDRKVILYSAIAVEAMVSTRLDEMHEAAQTVRPDDLRMVSMRGAGGTTVAKDPVFEFLRKGSKFRTLLHELPLYVLRRSVLLEDEQLFQDLDKLYGTRNRLVHGGHADAADLLTIDYHGAKKALRSAISAYRWFDAAGRYVTMSGSCWGVDESALRVADAPALRSP